MTKDTRVRALLSLDTKREFCQMQLAKRMLPAFLPLGRIASGRLELLLRFQLIESPQIHRLLKQGLNIRVECLPVRILRIALEQGKHFLTSSVIDQYGKASTYLEMILLALEPVTHQYIFTNANC